MSDMKPDLDHMRQEMAKAIKEHGKWFMGAGILFIGLGAAAVILPQIFTLVAEQFIGWLFLIGGIVLALKGFQAKGAPAVHRLDHPCPAVDRGRRLARRLSHSGRDLADPAA